MLSLGYTWTKGGSGQQFRIPTRWGKSGRINLIGTYGLYGVEEGLEVRELEGNCTGAQVMSDLDTLALECDPACITVVVLDNAPFHKGAKLREKQLEWERKGLFLRYLPPYAPFLNLIEEVWRRLKGFLLPRRCYDSVAALRQALHVALRLLNARFI
ncbi:hypothetical protein D3875_22365 [Deinococcus cavernae]|uniref:Tc1-like transposase DDE domain-containing protein n=2 Tax=Deinococcus cavernae TaxID=2320857 RepID=A0A418V036_9DEIO|nr:hypothetical protein D3875_22365 [Deinococcus cavernae]